CRAEGAAEAPGREGPQGLLRRSARGSEASEVGSPPDRSCERVGVTLGLLEARSEGRPEGTERPAAEAVWPREWAGGGPTVRSRQEAGSRPLESLAAASLSN